MVVWQASAKDCYDPATQETVECVICFEDFEEKQEIARLECLCRYHKVGLGFMGDWGWKC